MNLILYFLAGLFLFNSLPHLMKGITGQTHMTPFKRVSSPILNIVWSFINICVAFLISKFISAAPDNTYLLSFLVGGFFISIMDANLFSKPDARLPWQKD